LRATAGGPAPTKTGFGGKSPRQNSLELLGVPERRGVGNGMGALMGKVTKTGIDKEFQDQVRDMVDRRFSIPLPALAIRR
jgi:hypothetical protein